MGVYIEQPNRGLGAARNAGFRAAHGEYIVPLDADDLLQPAYIAECLAAIRDSDAAFAYTDFQVFGTETYQERPGEYNLYRLLDRNVSDLCGANSEAGLGNVGRIRRIPEMFRL